MDKELNAWIFEKTGTRLRAHKEMLELAVDLGCELTQEWDGNHYVIEGNGFSFVCIGKKIEFGSKVVKQLYYLIVQQITKQNGKNRKIRRRDVPDLSKEIEVRRRNRV